MSSGRGPPRDFPTRTVNAQRDKGTLGMTRLGWLGPLAVAISLTVSAPVQAGNGQGLCSHKLTKMIPNRKRSASSGSEVVREVMNKSGRERDAVIEREVLEGNMPGFIRDLVPVTVSGKVNGHTLKITLCVTPDYLAVGNDRDYVRVPLGMASAARVADALGFLLPTARIVDLIYAQAEVQLAPNPMEPGAAMTTTRYFMRHDDTVSRQAGSPGLHPVALVAGIKKDLVISERLRKQPGRVAIYGWHRTNGRPIQPLSLVHGADYADYSHGIRLVSRIAFINGRPVALDKVMQDPDIAAIVTGDEGPMRNVRNLMVSLYR